MNGLDGLRTRIFADGADLAGMLEMYREPRVAGFTTNPSLMRSAGVCDYAAFAKGVLGAISDRPISFETFADDFDDMERQAHEIASWGDNVYVKVPVTNTLGQSSVPLIARLRDAGVQLNVTALMTTEQVRTVADALAGGAPSFVSLFAGRIADTGRDPVPLVAEAVAVLGPHPQIKLIWASCREVLNIFQADSVGCHVITVTNDILKKLDLVGLDLETFSLDTVRMFYDDAQKSGFTL